MEKTRTQRERNIYARFIFIIELQYLDIYHVLIFESQSHSIS